MIGSEVYNKFTKNRNKLSFIYPEKSFLCIILKDYSVNRGNLHTMKHYALLQAKHKLTGIALGIVCVFVVERKEIRNKNSEGNFVQLRFSR